MSMEFRIIRSDADTLVTGSVGDPRVPISFHERAHSSSLANYFDFGRRGSTESPEEPDVTEPTEPSPVEKPQARQPDPPVEPRAEAPAAAPATGTPT